MSSLINGSIEVIWQTYHEKLFNFINNRVDQTSMAEDLLQDVFLKIYDRIDTLKDENKLQNWIYQIARNAIIDHYRSKKPMVDLPLDIKEDSPNPYEENREEIASWIQPMIGYLPETYRDTLQMSEIEGLPHKEIARRKSLSVSGVKSRVQRGRKLLQEMLTDCCLFEFDHQGRVMDYDRK